MNSKGWRLIETSHVYDEPRHRIKASSRLIQVWLAQQPSKYVQKELMTHTWYIDDSRLLVMSMKWSR